MDAPDCSARLVSDHKLFAANQAIAQERALTQQQELARGMNEPSQGGLSRWIARVWSTTPPSELDDDLHCITSHPRCTPNTRCASAHCALAQRKRCNLTPSHHHPHTPARSLETPHTAAPTSEFWWVFLCPAKRLGTARRSRAGRAANTTPARGISPPAVCGF
ncbi:hypothetical protein GDR29_22205 [Xanthomonas oryzae pv. oryzae]|nr:hypothetical protein GDR29_22205 [Xanthomonas oryzae pv. oryzae]